MKFGSDFTLLKKLKNFAIQKKFSNDAPLICITQFKFSKNGAHLDAFKIQWSLKSFFLFLNLKFQTCLVSTSKNCEIGFSVISSTTMPIFIIFYPHLLPQLSEKEIRKKKSKKKCKNHMWNSLGGKINGFNIWRRLDTWFYSCVKKIWLS